MGIIKTKEEIEKLRKAAILGDNCFDYICSIVKPGMTEIEIAKKIDDFFMKNGASATSFATIVGAGTNSAQIHAVPGDYSIQEQDIILFDFGCVLDGYCSDMSRTIFMGDATEKQRKIYSLVKKAHNNAVEKVKVNDIAKAVDSYGRLNIQEAGFDYAHALGHGVGTEVHEAPLISYKNEDILKENMVFTIEPGIYIEGEFGVRIEDTGVLTQNGMELFSKSDRDIIIL